MRVGVTGAAGGLGGVVVGKLLEQGHQVRATDLRLPDYYTTNARVRWLPTDISNEPALLRALDGADAVVHLAGVLGSEELWKTEAAAVRINLLGAINVLGICREIGARYVGVETGTFWNTPYSITKRAAREWAMGSAERFGQEVVVLRVMNVYGPFHSLESKVVPKFVEAAIRGEQIPIYGTGKQMLDLVWGDDVAECCVRAATVPYKGPQVVEVGSVAITALDFANVVWSIARPGEKARVRHLPARPNEGETRAPSIEGMQRHLGFVPDDAEEFSVFLDRMEHVVAYYRTKLAEAT